MKGRHTNENELNDSYVADLQVNLENVSSLFSAKIWLENKDILSSEGRKEEWIWMQVTCSIFPKNKRMENYEMCFRFYPQLLAYSSYKLHHFPSITVEDKLLSVP